jgi:hypothetical protein
MDHGCEVWVDQAVKGRTYESSRRMGNNRNRRPMFRISPRGTTSWKVFTRTMNRQRMKGDAHHVLGESLPYVPSGCE